jgi:ActR/RegA family two-component response regulator
MTLRPTHFEKTGGRAVGTALVMTTDNLIIDQFARAFKEIDVSTVSTSLVRDSLELIHNRKFEAFIVDTELDNDHLDLLSEVRSSPSNSTAVMIAIAPSARVCDHAKKSGANFCLEQPLTQDNIHRTLRASYGMIVRECRRYFRCPVKIPVTAWASVSGEIQGETIDISEDGMAIRIPYTLGVDTELLVRFKLQPAVKELVVRAKIIRTGDNGLAGLNFVEISAAARGQLHEWLSLRLEEKIPSLAKQSA